jgi:hypothetical protein
MLNASELDALPREQVKAFCEEMRRTFAQATWEGLG